MIKKIITIALLLVSCCTCFAQDVKTIYNSDGVLSRDTGYGRLDSVIVIFDKDGNRIRREYYHLKSDLHFKVKNTAKKPE